MVFRKVKYIALLLLSTLISQQVFSEYPLHSFEDTSLALLGRIHFDQGLRLDNPEDDVYEFRRLRLGTLFKHKQLKIKSELDFANDQILPTDVYIELSDRAKDNYVHIGHQKESLSLDYLASSNHYSLIERPSLNFYIPGRNIGVNFFSKLSDQVLLSSGLFYDSDSEFDFDTDSWSFSNRIAMHSQQDAALFHYGAFYSHREQDNLSIRSGPEISLSDLRTGIALDGLESLDLYGLEFAAMLGGLKLQSELVYTNYDLTGSGNDSYGYYAELGYITNGSYTYAKDKKVFVAPKVEKHALEWVLRASTLQNRIDQIGFGHQNNYTFGLNYYLAQNVRMMLNIHHLSNSLTGHSNFIAGRLLFYL